MKSVILSPWEVRAVLGGSKSEFRRVVDEEVTPYWVVGEHYFVRETFARGMRDKLYYRADAEELRAVTGGWLAPQHMHYYESRLTLVATEVRQERLHSAPEYFWHREGVEKGYGGMSSYDWWIAQWDKGHPKGQRYDDNPMVWAVSHERL